MATLNRPILERIQEKLSPPNENGCRLWLDHLSPKGYGQIWYKGTNRRAHRVAWEVAYGPIPEGMLVCHKCDVPACCNVTHLFLGTALDNQRDKVKKNRQSQGKAHAATFPDRKGENHPGHKVTWGQVAELRALYDTGEYTLKALGKRYRITDTMAGYIAKRQNWLSNPQAAI